MRVAFLDRTDHAADAFGEALIAVENNECITVSEIKKRIRGFSQLTGCKNPDVRMTSSFVRALDGKIRDYVSRSRITFGRDTIIVHPAGNKSFKTKPEFVERMRIHLRIKQ